VSAKQSEASEGQSPSEERIGYKYMGERRVQPPSPAFKRLRRFNIMKILDFLSKKAIITDLKSSKKEDVLRELVDAMVVAGEIEKRHRNKLIEALLAREALGSTAIGQGVGIPHAKSDCVKKLVAAFGLSRKGVNFDSLDGEPVYIFFLLLAPADSAGPHLKALARVSRLLKDKYFRDSLRQCQDDKSVIKIITQEDERKI
jgi:PTS system nitrogen regulatory IIA component